MGDPHFGGYPYSPYISYERYSVGQTATACSVLWQLLQEPLFTSKRAITQQSAYDVPSRRWGQRGLLAQPSKVQLYVWATITQSASLSTQVCVHPSTAKSLLNVRQMTSLSSRMTLPVKVG